MYEKASMIILGRDDDMAKKDYEKLEETLNGLNRRLEKLEDRFYQESEHSVTDRVFWVHRGITDDGPPAEELLGLILDHLGLEIEGKWKLKKK